MSPFGLGRSVIACPVLVLACAGGVCRAAPDAAAPAEQATARHARIVDCFLNSKWDELAEEVKIPPKELAAMTAEQRADVAYVRKAWADCRPDWWRLGKQAKKAALRVTLWDRTFTATFAPGDKTNLNMQFGGSTSVEVTWNPSLVDSTDSAGGSMASHGCTAGDMADLSIWGTLANAYFMGSMPASTLMDLYNRDKEHFQRCELFHSNVTALYQCSPRSRHAALVIHLAAFMPKYGSGPLAGASRAVGSMFVATVLADPPRWPSLPLPSGPAAAGAEEKVAVHYKFRVGKAWTLAEDKALREATAAFYKANQREILRSGKVTLPNGLAFMLDPQKDGECKAKRDEWVAQQLQKALAAGK